METTLTAAATVLMWGPGLWELAIIAIILLLVVVLPIAVVVMIIKSVSARSSGASAREEQILREMHAGFQRMEDRIQALETIAMERGRGKSGDSQE